jgi:hypothetical protein
VCDEAEAEADRHNSRQPLRSCRICYLLLRASAGSVSEKVCDRETKIGERSGVAQRLRVFALPRG